jgi:ribosomal protein L11 methylase PrmA
MYHVRFFFHSQDPQATNIIINPGLAFGTGEHPTTKLCLLFLKEVIKGGERVLDYGTGTGVLSIAALKVSCIGALLLLLFTTSNF